MPPETTITVTALLMGLGVAPMTGCLGADDVESSSEVSGADYGGPEAGDWSSDEIYSEGPDTEDTGGSTDAGSTSDTETDGSTSSSDTTETTETTETGGLGMCGWDAMSGYYECGFEGTDPGGSPIECPVGLVEGDPCTNTGLTATGCCDANADSWYCAGDLVFFNACF